MSIRDWNWDRIKDMARGAVVLVVLALVWSGWGAISRANDLLVVHAWLTEVVAEIEGERVTRADLLDAVAAQILQQHQRQDQARQDADEAKPTQPDDEPAQAGESDDGR